MKEIVYSRQAFKALRRARVDAMRLDAALRRYAETGHGDVKDLVGRPGEKRLRAGGWRLVFVETAETITVIGAGPRGGVYDAD